jgi:hypothetical protein
VCVHRRGDTDAGRAGEGKAGRAGGGEEATLHDLFNEAAASVLR